MSNSRFHHIAKAWLSQVPEKSDTLNDSNSISHFHKQTLHPSVSSAGDLTDPHSSSLRHLEELNQKLPSFSLRRQAKSKSPSPSTSELNPPSFDATQFFIAGWQGDSLASKHFFKAKKNFEEGAFKIKLKLLKEKNYPLKIFQSFYQEFFYFHKVNYPEIEESEIISEAEFIQNFKFKIDDQFNSISAFFGDFSQKILALHWMKLRFIKKVIPSESFIFNEKELLTPHSLLWKLFPVGSGNELKSKLFHADQYSWIRLDEELLGHVKELYSLSNELSFAEIFKIITLNEPKAKTFSHSMSSKSLGLMINSLIINLSNWLEISDQQISTKKVESNGIKLKNTLFLGDYLLELSLSHWLAQENNAHFKWEDIIIPYLQDKSTSQVGPSSTFYQKINEAQFLSFFADISPLYSQQKTKFLKEVINRSHSSLYEDTTQVIQGSLLQEFQEGSEIHECVVMSLTNVPKNNGHFHLISGIQQSATKLKLHGQLIVLTSQNLFVPSQGERVQGLLKKMKLVGSINMESLQGRGEVPSFIYVFKKLESDSNELERQAFSHFRLSGELKTFSQYSHFPEEITHFFKRNWQNPPSLYHMNLPGGLELDFHTEVIVNGQLISPGNSNHLPNVAHPNFFKNMTLNCLPLSYFYEVSSVENEKLKQGIVSTFQQEKQISFESLAQDFTSYGQALIIDFRNSQEIKLEIIHPETLVSKAYEYGVAQCFYFLLRPKVKNLNPNIFKNYFDSPLGRQIIQISFQGPFHQLKSKIVTLLIPKIFAGQDRLPASVVMKVDQIIQEAGTSWKLQIAAIEKGMQELKEEIEHLSPHAITTLVGMLSSLKVQVINLFSEWKNTKNVINMINFDSLDTQKKLSKCKSIGIYPGHPEVNVEFLGNLQSAPNAVYVSHQLEISGQGKAKITLYSHLGPTVVIQSSLEIMGLITKILSHLKGRTVEQILLGLKVPLTQDLITQLSLERPDGKAEESTLKHIEELLNFIFIKLIKSNS
ncbi:MAG: hypothetical protein QE271_05115 [Bacteriovoracaceae bacterium]|nr:hypothetical protein [Bacteriovoracaceae bacterium]